MQDNKIPIVVLPKRPQQPQPNNPIYRKVQVIKKIDLSQHQKNEDQEILQPKVNESQSSYCSPSMKGAQDPFLNFVNSYSLFINDASSANLDLDLVLNNLNNAINQCKPPINDPTLNQFHQSLMIEPQSINQLAADLKQLPDQKLYQCIQYVEKLNVKLLLDYNIEVNKGTQIGIIKEEENN